MNPHAAVFQPSGALVSRTGTRSHSEHHHHHSNGHPKPFLSKAHHKHGQQIHGTSTETTVRINQNILSPASRSHPSKQSTVASALNANNTQFPLSPLFNQNTFEMQAQAQAQQQQQHASSISSPHSDTPSSQAAHQFQFESSVHHNMSQLQNQQVIYQQLHQLSEQGQQVSVRINSVLQPQLSELSDQMQTALFNCNHVTQPEYYAGLQNQHLILTQSMKEAQQQYQTITYQYQYYQHMLLQQQQQQQAHAQQQQQQTTPVQSPHEVIDGGDNHTKLLNGYKEQLAQMYDNSNVLYDKEQSTLANRYNEAAPANINCFDKKKNSKHTYSKQDIFERKLCVLISKLTPDRFDKVLAKMLEFLDNHVQTQNELKMIVDKVVRFTLNQAYLASLTAKLFLHFYDYLPRLMMTQQYQQHLWDTHDVDISLTFRKILITALEKLFSEFRGELERMIVSERNTDDADDGECDSGDYKEEEHDEDDEEKECDEEELNPEKCRIRADFLALIEIIGELYKMDLVHIRVLRKGIFDKLLAIEEYTFDVIDIEAICVMFRSCGKKLDAKQSRFVDKCFSKVSAIVASNHLRNKSDDCCALQMISDVRAIRCNNWVIHKIAHHNQKYRTVKLFQIPLDEIREESHHSQSYKLEERESHHNRAEVEERQSQTKTTSAFMQFYGYCSQHNELRVIESMDSVGFIKSIEFGYSGSRYILSDDGRLMVSGNNTFGELGIENEVIDQIVRYWSTIISKDISYLICTFVDDLRYKCDTIASSSPRTICCDMNGGDPGDGRLISCGIAARHRFVLTNGDQLYGAGCNTFNQLGNDTVMKNTFDYPQEVDAMRCKNSWTKINFFSEHCIKLRSIQCGYSTSSFLSEDGAIYTVGYSSFGNLGIGDKRNKLSKITKIYTIKTRIVSISCGFDHTLAINEYQYVLSYGDNGFGQLGHGHVTQNRRQKPKEIEYFQKHNIHAIQICCGAFHSLVLDCNGLIYCFGYNLGYQCHYHNDDDDLNIATPKMNNILHNIDKVTNIKCGAFHNLVETQHNQWYLWGDNRNKQCLVHDDKKQFLKVPTKYEQNDIKQNESIVDMFPGYDETIVFTTKLSV
eukprot:326569_1